MFVERARWWTAQSCPPLSQIVSECIEAKRKANRRDQYVRELKRVLLHFTIGREAADLREISPSEIEDFCASKNYSAPTRATVITRLGALFSFAQRRGYIEHNPISRLERIAIEIRPPEILPPKEAERLLNAAQQHDRRLLAYLAIGLFGGVRSAELDRLTWANVDISRGVIMVDAAASKVRQRRIVRLEPKGIHWLAKADCRFPILPKSKAKRLWRLALLLGWRGWPHNILRHTAASFLLALHKDAGKVALMLGNSPGILLSRYTELVSAEDCATFWSIDKPEDAKENI